MLNKIILMGRLTRDPELRRTGSGTAVTSFALAVDRDFKGQGGEKETDFIDIVAWRSTAEFVSKYFTKGRMAVVEGRLQIGTGRTRTAASAAAPKWWPTTSISGTATRTAVIGLEAEATVAATTTATSSPAEIFPRFPMTTPVNCRSDRRMRDGTTNYPLPR